MMNKTYRAILVFSLVIGTAVGLFLHLAMLITLPLPGLLGFALAAAYCAVVIAILARTPLWPHGPGAWKWVLAALLWGGGTSLALVMAAGDAFTDLVNYTRWYDSSASWGGAYPEEIVKAAGVTVIALSSRRFVRPWHVLCLGMVVGLGFEAGENAMYGVGSALMHPVNDWEGFWETWGLRMFMGPGLHIMFTGIASWGIGWALFGGRGWTRLRRLKAALGCLFIAFLTHFLWNYGMMSLSVVIVTCVLAALIGYPTLGYFIYRGVRLSREDPGYAVQDFTRP